MRDWFTCDLDASPEAPREARHKLNQFLADRTESGRVHVAALLVTEVVANAVKHGGAPIRVDARIDAGRLRVAVHDPAPGEPVPLHAGPEATSGRGLDLVSALADSWGVEPSSAGFGKAVWFEMTLSTVAAGMIRSATPRARKHTRQP